MPSLANPSRRCSCLVAFLAQAPTFCQVGLEIFYSLLLASPSGQPFFLPDKDLHSFKLMMVITEEDGHNHLLHLL